MNTSVVKLTYEDYLEYPEDGLRHELIDGEHYVTPAPHHRHQRLVSELLFAFASHLKTTDTGLVYTAPIDVKLSDVDVVQPDLILLLRPHLGRLHEKGYVDGPPDLIVEILSPNTRRRDQTIKLRTYERFGIPEYWVVDLDIDEVHVFRLQDGRYVECGRFYPGDVVTSPLFPGLAIAVSDIF